MQMYLVGGAVRDELLGLKSKDQDFSVVLDPSEITSRRGKGGKIVPRTPFEVMCDELDRRGFTIYKRFPEHLTVRGRFPDYHRARAAVIGNREHPRMDADFVLSREEGPYSDGRRPDWVRPGTLRMDQDRRDFTVNAIAKDAEGNYIDPHNGRADLDARILRAVGDPRERLREDALRALRALRFSLTKGFRIEGELDKVLHFDSDLHDMVAFNISDERKREELNKMFAFNTIEAVFLLHKYPALFGAIFSGGITLEATMRRRK